MRAEIKLITPEVAKELLKMNIGNRDVKSIKSSYVNQMKNGLWKENGEPIIVDKKGVIKDGQHRLYSCIEADFSWICPIIYDVDPNVMDTIDTGTNRSLSDVLKLNGFIYNGQISMLIKAIFKYDRNMTSLQNSGNDKYVVTNAVGLEYAKNNKEGLISICRAAQRINDKQGFKILSLGEISIYLYILSKGFNLDVLEEEFLNGVCGITADSNSSSHYVFKKLLAAKDSKINMKSLYKTNIVIKCFNIFCSSDMPIAKLHVKSDKYEKVL